MSQDELRGQARDLMDEIIVQVLDPEGERVSVWSMPVATEEAFIDRILSLGKEAA